MFIEINVCTWHEHKMRNR